MFGKNVGPSHKFSDINVQNLPWIQRYNGVRSLAAIIWFEIRLSEFRANTLARECRAAPSKLANVATRHEEALAGQKMSRCCSNVLWPVLVPFSGAPVQPNILNMPKSASWVWALGTSSQGTQR